MPRSADFYDKMNNQPAPTQPAPVQPVQNTPPVNQENNQPPIINSKNFDPSFGGVVKNKLAQKALKIGFDASQLFGMKDMREVYPDLPTDWQQKTIPQQMGWLYKANAKKTFDMAVGLPGAIVGGFVKAPFQIEQTVADAGMALGDVAANLTKKIPGDPIGKSLRSVFGTYDTPIKLRENNYDIPVLGNIRGFGGSYEEGINMGLDPIMAAVKATGEVGGDAVMALGISDLLASAFKPRFVDIKAPIKGKDIRATKAVEIKSPEVKASDSKITTNGVFFESKQNPNITNIRLDNFPDIAERMGVPAKNTIVKISPLGTGEAEYRVVQIRPSFAEKVGKFFEKEKRFVDSPNGAMGKEITLKSGIIKYDSNLIKNGTSPSMEGSIAATNNVSNASVISADSAPVQNFDDFIKGMSANDIFGPVSIAEKYSFTPEMESQYANFKKLKLRDLDQIEDSAQLKTIKSRLPANQIDNMLYSQEKTGDEVFDLFKQRLLEERASKNGNVSMPQSNAIPENLPANQAPVAPNTVAPLTDKERFDLQTAQAPRMIPKPFKGMEDNLVDGSEVSAINFLKESNKIEEPFFQALSQAITGKININEMTKQNAYDLQKVVSDTFSIGSERTNYPVDWKYVSDSFLTVNRYNMARYRFDSMDRNLGTKIMENVYYPIEIGYQLSKAKINADNISAMNGIFSKIKDPKYSNDIRIISQYVKTGDKKLFTGNKEITPEMAKNFTEVGDWLRDYYKTMKEKNNIATQKWADIYSPEIMKGTGPTNLYKNLEELPADFRPFYEFQREGQFNELEDNPIVLWSIYNAASIKNEMVAPALAESKKYIGSFQSSMPNIFRDVNDYTQERMGYQGKLEEHINGFFGELSKKMKWIPKDIHKAFIDMGITGVYSSAFFNNVGSMARNSLQTINLYNDMGPRKFAKSLVDFISNPKKAYDYAKENGFLIDKGQAYGDDLYRAENNGKLAKALGTLTSLNEKSIIPYGFTDSGGRAMAAYSYHNIFQENWNLFKENKISFDDFSREIDMKAMGVITEDIVRKKLLSGDPKQIAEAEWITIDDSINRTLYPYRKASQGRALYGLEGKAMGMFMQYFGEATQMITKYVTRRQWPKLLRFYYTGEMMKRTAKDYFGVDISNWVGGPGVNDKGQLTVGQYGGVVLNPAMNLLVNGITAVAGSANDSSSAVKSSLDEILKTLKFMVGSVPGTAINLAGKATGNREIKEFTTGFGGVEMSRIDQALQAVKRENAGISISPDPSKPFAIFSKSTGKNLYGYMSAEDLIKYSLGFKPNDVSNQAYQTNVYIKAQNKKTELSTKALNILVDGDTEGFIKFVNKNNIQINDLKSSLKSFTEPLNIRQYQRMSPRDRIRYFNLFYPSKQ